MPTLRLLVTGVAFGAPFFRDRDSIWAVRADPDEVIDYTLDWTGWLAGDTISTSSWQAENATVNSVATLGATAGARIGNALYDAGAARASGYVGQADAVKGGVRNALYGFRR